MLLFGLLGLLFPVEVQELGFLLEHKNAVEHITQEADRDGGDGAGEVVVDVPLLQQPDTEAVAEPAHHIHHDESEEQPLFVVLENDLAIGREVEQDADDVAEEGGEHVGVGDMEKVDEPEERGINAPAEGRIQYGYQHKTDELRVNIPV